MAERSVGSFTLQFGLVSFVTKMYTAAKASDSKVSFNMLHGQCGTRLKQAMLCNVCGTEAKPYLVPSEEIVKGYCYDQKEQKYLVMTDDDLNQLPIGSKETIAVSSFFPASEIDPVYYEKTYYLKPDKGSDRPFALLARVLEADQLVALAKITVRKREQQCLLRVGQGILFLHPLFCGDELRIALGAQLPEVSEDELGLARMLVQRLQQPFDPEAYGDPYVEAFEALVARRLDPKAPQDAPVAVKAPVKVFDLAAQLRASLEAAPAAVPAPKAKTTSKRKAG